MSARRIQKGATLRRQSNKIQANVESYAYYVVRNLVDIKGRSESDVVGFIVKDWIGDHREELREYGIHVAAWKADKRNAS